MLCMDKVSEALRRRGWITLWRQNQTFVFCFLLAYAKFMKWFAMCDRFMVRQGLQLVWTMLLLTHTQLVNTKLHGSQFWTVWVIVLDFEYTI